MKQTVRKSLAWLTSLLLVLGTLGLVAPSSAPVQAAELNVAGRTQQEIADYAAAHPVDLNLRDQYEVATSSDPYSAGKLSAQTTQNALNLVNQLRYIAGLDEVVLDEIYQKMCMDAALVNALNGSLSHYPERPEELAGAEYDELYQSGYNGAGRSNIGYGHYNLVDSILNGYMDDSDSSNIDRLGHRRWILNPSMGKTGFGAVARSGYLVEYFAMYAMDRSGSGTATQVAWPAQNTPVEYVTSDLPWSVSVNSPEVDAASVQVTLVQQPGGRTWTFSQSSSDGYFNVNNDYYGVPGCVIFQPDGLVARAGDSYDVTITGLPGGESLSYTVNFFQLSSSQLPSEEPEPSPEEEFSYEIYADGSLQITGYLGSNTKVIIPETIHGISVQGIGLSYGQSYSGWRGVEEVTLPSSLEFIAYGAFEGATRLTRVNFPEDSQVWMVGDRAFEGCTNLNEITLPDSVWMLGEDIFTGTAFYNNSRNWENGALYNGNHLISVQAGFSGVCTVREGTISLADNCFLGCTGLMGANLPQGLVYLGDNSFQGTGIQQIAIPKSVTYLGIEAFADCPNLALVRVENPDAEYYDDSCFRNSPNVSLSGAMGSTTFHYAWKQYLPFRLMDGSLPKYDFNYDGEENVLDVMRLAQVVLHRPDGKLGDLDGNGRVEVTDAMRAANYLVNR